MGGSSNPLGIPGSKLDYYRIRRSGAPGPTAPYAPSVKQPQIDYPDSAVVQQLLKTVVFDVLGQGLPVSFLKQLENSKILYQMMRKWVVSYDREFKVAGPEIGFQMFRADWRTYRLVIPLQLRLIVEQALYDLDNPWRSLVTGFAPVKG